MAIFKVLEMKDTKKTILLKGTAWNSRRSLSIFTEESKDAGQAW